MLIEAFNYKHWATQRTLAAIAQVDAVAFPATVAFACQQLNHLRIVEELFQARLLGDAPPHTATNSANVPPLELLAQRLEQLQAWYAAYVPALDAQQLQETVTFDFVDGRGGCMSRQEILFHIINHGTYHRGAIGHALDLVQVAHPADTYTVFIHEAEPERRLRG